MQTSKGRLGIIALLVVQWLMLAFQSMNVPYLRTYLVPVGIITAIAALTVWKWPASRRPPRPDSALAVFGGALALLALLLVIVSILVLGGRMWR